MDFYYNVSIKIPTSDFKKTSQNFPIAVYFHPKPILLGMDTKRIYYMPCRLEGRMLNNKTHCSSQSNHLYMYGSVFSWKRLYLRIVNLGRGLWYSLMLSFLSLTSDRWIYLVNCKLDVIVHLHYFSNLALTPSEVVVDSKCPIAHEKRTLEASGWFFSWSFLTLFSWVFNQTVSWGLLVLMALFVPSWHGWIKAWRKWI